MESYFKTCK